MQIEANGGMALFIFYFDFTLFLSNLNFCLFYFQCATSHAVLMDLIATSITIF